MAEAIESREIGGCVVVEFDDGMQTTFHPYRHGFGYQIEGLRRFTIVDKDGNMMVEYNARLYYSGPREDEHQFVQMADGWTKARIVEYWEKARKFCNELFWGEGGQKLGREPNDKWWYHWRVTMEGWIDLDKLRRESEDT